MTKRLFFALTLFAFALVLGACSDNGSKEVIGAWKSEKDGPYGKPYTLLIDEKRLVEDMNMDRIENVTFAKGDGKIFILSTSGLTTTKERPWYTVTIIDKDKAIFNNTWDVIFVRTTPEELQRIAAMP